MALVPVQRNVPIARSPVSFFEPQWQVGTWDNFFNPSQMMPFAMPPMPTMEQAIQQMNRQFVEMQERMNRMMAEFQRLLPVNVPRPADNMGIQKSVITEPDGTKHFRLDFDVRNFRPDELEITTNNNVVTVHGRHQAQNNHGQAVSEHRRQYLLPPEVEADRLRSTLSPEGVLTLEAPMGDRPAVTSGPQLRRLALE